jgi:hypothetical protein
VKGQTQQPLFRAVTPNPGGDIQKGSLEPLVVFQNEDAPGLFDNKQAIRAIPGSLDIRGSLEAIQNLLPLVGGRVWNLDRDGWIGDYGRGCG